MTMFACLYKLPVILKILKKKGGDGLSLISVYLGNIIITIITISLLLISLETCGYVSAVIYNFKRHNHISTYGDICASVIQNFMIILLIWSWGANGVKVSFSHILLVLLLASMLLFGVFQSSGDSIKYISMFSTSVIIFSRLPQIISNATTGNIGVQSIITLFNATLGAILKAWIYYENKDYVQVGGALVAFSLNAILSVQFLYLGGLNDDTKANVKATENVSEKAIKKESENNKNLRKRVKK